jgi:DNA-binding CsgD family transcriptional regulator
VGTWTDGLYYQDVDENPGSFEKVTQLTFNDIVDLFFDPVNNELWVAGSENIGLLKSSIVSTVHAVGPNRIESISFDEKDGIYYSIGEQMLYLSSPYAPDAKHVLSSENSYFERLLVQGDKIWIADAFGAIFSHDLNSGNERLMMEGTVNFSIQFLMRDTKGNKWFAGHSRGLIKIDSLDRITVYDKLQQTVLTRESSNGQLYCGSNGKGNLLTLYDPKTDSFDKLGLTYTFDCPDNLVLNDFQIDTLNNIWLATDEGLLKIDGKQKKHSEVVKFVIPGINPNEPIRAIAFVGEYICLAVAQGLIISKGDEYILFTQDSGLPSKILQERGLVTDPKGNLFVCTAKGLAVIQKDAIRFQQTVTPQLKTLMINGSLRLPADSVEGHPYKTKLETEFISLAYPATNIMYQSRIIGINENWSAPSTNRTLSVLEFPEGNYQVEIRAREDGKLWSSPMMFKLAIDKPWYRTWWAIAGFFIGGFLVVIVATHIHNNNLIRQKKKLQKIVEERTEQVNQQKNEIIEQQKRLIQQKEELLAKNEAVYKSQQALVEADMNYLQLKEKQLRDQIEYKNKQITTHALNILQKNETLNHLREQLEEIVKNSHKISMTEIRKTVKTIDESFKLDKDWEDFRLYFEQIHTGFYAKLNISYPDLTPLELRHCALIRLNLTLAECASILGISNDSIKVSRTRLRKKLNLDANQSLTEFIMGI